MKKNEVMQPSKPPVSGPAKEFAAESSVCVLLPELTGLSIMDRLDHARVIIRSLVADSNRSDGVAAPAPPEPIGLTVEQKLSAACRIIQDLRAQNAQKKAPAVAAEATTAAPTLAAAAASTMPGGDSQTGKTGDGVTYRSKTSVITRPFHQNSKLTTAAQPDPAPTSSPPSRSVDSSQQQARITRFPTGRISPPEPAQSSEGSAVYESKTCKITRPSIKRETAPPQSQHQSGLVEKWLSIKRDEAEGLVPAGAAFEFFRKNQAGMRIERAKIRNPDAHIVSTQRNS